MTASQTVSEMRFSVDGGRTWAYDWIAYDANGIDVTLPPFVGRKSVVMEVRNMDGGRVHSSGAVINYDPSDADIEPDYEATQTQERSLASEGSYWGGTGTLTGGYNYMTGAGQTGEGGRQTGGAVAAALAGARRAVDRERGVSGHRADGRRHRRPVARARSRDPFRGTSTRGKSRLAAQVSQKMRDPSARKTSITPSTAT